MTPDATALLTIGELADRTGLPVRTIRFYSDSGVVPPADRTDAGYRLYGADALVRLALVRTLRDLGLGLATIRRVLEREVSVVDAAATHARALDAQIRLLRVQRAVLGAVARRGSDPEEMQTMHRLAQLSDDERRRIVAEFLDETFAGLDIDPEFEARMRSAQPQLPEDPSPEQIEAAVELGELLEDEDFRRTIRRMSEHHAAARGAEGSATDWGAAAALVAQKGEGARAADVDPAGPEAAAIVDTIVPAFAGPEDDPADPAWRAALADRLVQGTDSRAERYWQLLATINGWPPVPTAVPAWEWLIAALRASR